MNAYQELILAYGYDAASLFAYLAGMADREGNYNCSIRGLAKVTGLSVQRVRTLLLCYQSTHLITQQTTHLSTQITICKRTNKHVSKNTSKHTSQHTSQHTKEVPLSSPSNVSPTPPSYTPPIIPQETHAQNARASERFMSWLLCECPYIAAHLKPLTDDELNKLKQRFSAEEIMEVCYQIENRKDHRKNYTNLYRTLLNWLKRRNENNRTTHPTAEDRQSAAYNLMQRLAAEDGNTLF